MCGKGISSRGGELGSFPLITVHASLFVHSFHSPHRSFTRSRSMRSLVSSYLDVSEVQPVPLPNDVIHNVARLLKVPEDRANRRAP